MPRSREITAVHTSNRTRRGSISFDRQTCKLDLEQCRQHDVEIYQLPGCFWTLCLSRVESIPSPFWPLSISTRHLTPRDQHSGQGYQTIRFPGTRCSPLLQNTPSHSCSSRSWYPHAGQGRRACRTVPTLLCGLNLSAWLHSCPSLKFYVHREWWSHCVIGKPLRSHLVLVDESLLLLINCNSASRSE